MIPSKTCHYCQKETQYAPIPIVGTHSTADRGKTLRVHYCADCAAEYVYWSHDGELGSVHLYTIVNNKMYRWSTSVGEKKARLWYVEKPGIPGKQANQGLALLKTLEEHPDLTPQNVGEKIRFMLPFL